MRDMKHVGVAVESSPKYYLLLAPVLLAVSYFCLVGLFSIG